MKFMFDISYEKIKIFDSLRAWVIGWWSYSSKYGGEAGFRLLGVSFVIQWRR